MTDAELLKFAAKAAGYTFVHAADDPKDGILLAEMQYPWNPLDKDGEALRLAVALEFRIDICNQCSEYRAQVWGHNEYADEGVIRRESGETKKDLSHATRRAIVRAAAEIGKSMP